MLRTMSQSFFDSNRLSNFETDLRSKGYRLVFKNNKDLLPLEYTKTETSSNPDSFENSDDGYSITYLG